MIPDKNIKDIKADIIVTNSYVTYGKYANSTRAAVGIDGLKSVQRRMLLAVRDEAKNEFTGSGKVVGRCLGSYHPHGDSAYDTLVKLVRSGFVEGQGNFGCRLMEELGAAALRYTKVKANSAFNESTFKLVEYCPSYENEFGIDEPVYLPVPIPLVLTTGGGGIGIGMASSYPAFNPTSILKAAALNDYTKLQAPKGLNIVSSDIERLWEFGEGWIRYSFDVYQDYSEIDGKEVCIIKGNSRLYSPSILSEFSKELSEESVYYRDESTCERDFKVIVSRVKGIKRVTDEEIYEKCKIAASKVFYYRLYIAEGDIVKKISLKEWLKLCWTAYQNIVDKWRVDTIKKLNHRKSIYLLIPKVYPLIKKDFSSADIATKLGEDISIILEIESKPIKLLRSSDFTSVISGIDNELSKVTNTSVSDLSVSFIKSF